MKKFITRAVALIVGTVACSDTSVPAGPTPILLVPRPTGVIAFVSTRDGNPEIYTANADGTNVTRLTNHPAEDTDPVWSPDGKRIAFVSSRAGQDASDIYVMDADGRNVVRRTTVGWNLDPAWSPDSRHLAFATRREAGPGAIDEPGRQLIYVMDVDGDWQKPVLIGFANDLHEWSPAWSPDGAKIIFTSAGDYTAGYFIANANGSGISRLLPSVQNPTSASYILYENSAWSPDGSRIAAFRCYPFPCMGRGDLITMNPDGTDVRTIAGLPQQSRVTWAPDGKMVAFSAPCLHSCNGPSIEYLRLDGSGGGILMPDAYSPSWRPDRLAPLPAPPASAAPAGVTTSNRVASAGGSFISAVPGTFPTAGSITVRNRTAGGVAIAARLADGGFDPVTAPGQSGDEILITINRKNGEPPVSMATRVPPRRRPAVVRTSPAKGRTDVALNVQIDAIFTEPLDRSSLTENSFRVLRSGQAIPGVITLSTDGLTASFTPDDPLDRLTSYTIELTESILDLDGDALEEAESATFTTVDRPAGMLAFVSDRHGNPEIFVGNADGTEITRLTNSPAADVNPTWSPDGTRIAFLSNRSGEFHLYVMNADGSAVTRRTSSPVVKAGLAWSADGKRIAYASYNGPSFFGGSSIRVADADGDWSESVAYNIADEAYSNDPTWSHDGKRIAFASDWGVFDGQEIYVMNSDGTDAKVLVKNTVDWTRYDVGNVYYQPAWSPDGTRIAVVACHFAPHDCYPYSAIMVVNADGSGLRMVKFSGGEAHPAWSPDGQYIAYASSACFVCPRTIRYTRADGNNEAIVNDALIENAYGPAWRPAGNNSN